ncbi:hypothetical protein PENTCL1PPCAC_14589, partial [Pristionchus entomophagus]
ANRKDIIPLLIKSLRDFRSNSTYTDHSIKCWRSEIDQRLSVYKSVCRMRRYLFKTGKVRTEPLT